MTQPAPRLFALNSVMHATGGTLVGVIAKRTYSVRAGQCHVADVPDDLAELVAWMLDKDEVDSDFRTSG